MTRIALTGAGGNVGRALVDAFDDADEVLPFSHSEHDDLDSELLDVTDPDDVTEKLDNVDVVVHLAGASQPDAEWETVSETNIQGTKHVMDAAVENGIDRVVFASSNHAVGTYNAADGDPESMTIGYAQTVDADAPTRPDSFYGVSKAACEGLTKFYADSEGLEVVNVRIGWYMSEDDLREAVDGDGDPGKERFARALWLSPHDCRDVHEKAATVDLPENPVTVNAVSRNDARFHSITETMRLLGYEPRDNAAEVLDE
ncbi:NAD-dependent epimerase/dehydratase family protein [Halosimplex salinum]|uniref:NAD-dependent epimerase/dehydratase family protein n=1 Tax=Halosimplex salinum TaxID=1710538 RepID=UPI000F49E759|nr:NAD(P)-dependent oxidoreductase [Halosimplex salinum]